ncbi:MAG: ferrous iron transport protein A [Chloroflexi bacterium]|nr:ferrous iron transport protein A [Chloroflexota bacterium]
MNISLPSRSSKTPPLLPGEHLLTEVPRKQEVHLLRIAAGTKATQRLAEMGLTPGVRFQILQNNGGPILLRLRGSRLAIGRGLAAKIWVSLQEED